MKKLVCLLVIVLLTVSMPAALAASDFTAYEPRAKELAAL